MRKEPKRNIESYQQVGHLNEFEFQKSLSEMAEESELPFTDETDKPNLTQAKRVAEVTAEAHRKVEKSAKKTTTRAGTKRRANEGEKSWHGLRQTGSGC